MRNRWIVLPLLVSLLAAGCGSDDEGAKKKTTAPAVVAPSFPAGTTMAAIQQRGKLVVGTKFDQPGFGQKDAISGSV
jgi:glutamate transport system substrate-binding protein